MLKSISLWYLFNERGLLVQREEMGFREELERHGTLARPLGSPCG